MNFINLLPFANAPKRPTTSKSAQIIDPAEVPTLMKLFKVAALGLGQQGGGGGRSRGEFEDSPYDFASVIQALDTDSYVRQGFSKYKELIWKEGWAIVGENPEAVAYLYQRIDFLELAMGRPFQDFLVDVADQLVKFANSFVAKSRGDITSFFPLPLQGPDNKEPVIGYYLVPTETMQIQRDKNNIARKYQQNVEGGGGARNPTWNPEDIIHFYTDKKPGRAFGVPFILPVLDDVRSLRQIEEDTLNLVHQELFPLYVYTVGTDEHPADNDEIIKASNELENLRTEGGMIIPERHKIEVLGAENHALDARQYLQHFVHRVVMGMGLAPHHLGIMNEGGNRSVTDRLDIALYDKVKTYQRYISRMIETQILNELLLEAGFDPYINPEDTTSYSDRCSFKFKEIDVDTQVKKEAAILQKFTANVATLPETRLALGTDPEIDEAELLMAIQARLNPDAVVTTSGTDGTKTPATVDTTPAGAQKELPSGAPANGQKGKANTPQKAANQVGNKVRPKNQQGQRTSPNIRHWADWADGVADLLETKELE